MSIEEIRATLTEAQRQADLGELAVAVTALRVAITHTEEYIASQGSFYGTYEHQLVKKCVVDLRDLFERLVMEAPVPA